MRYSSLIRRRGSTTPAGRAHHPAGGGRRSEAGYILIIFLVVLTLMMIALTAAAPRLAQQIQRDREIELVHRGEQYARAIKRYYKKFGRYPVRIEDLESTNTLRFLRKRYKDPITGGPWRLVRYGEIQLLSGGGVGAPAQLPGQANTPQAGSQSGLFNLNFGGAPGQPNPATATTGANTTSTPGGTTATNSTTAGTGTTATTDTSSGTTGTATYGTTGTTGSTGPKTDVGLFGQPATGSPGQTTSSPSSPFSSPAGSAQPGGGGGPIIGVASLSKKNGIHEFNKKSAYNEWLFVYDPAQDRGQLLHGPYNPQAFFGQASNNPSGTSPAGRSGPGTPTTTGTPGTGVTGTPSPTSPATGMPTGQPSGSIVPATQ